MTGTKLREFYGSLFQILFCTRVLLFMSILLGIMNTGYIYGSGLANIQVTVEKRTKGRGEGSVMLWVFEKSNWLFLFSPEGIGMVGVLSALKNSGLFSAALECFQLSAMRTTCNGPTVLILD